MKNGEKSSKICSRKCLGSVTEAPQLWFSSRKHIFSPKTTKMHSQGVMNILKQPPSPIYREMGGGCRPEAYWGRFLSASQLLSSPPFSNFTEKLPKPYESVLDLIFIFFFSSLSPILSEICLPKVFRNFTEALWKARSPGNHFSTKRGEACRPVASSLSNQTSKMFRKGLDSNCYLHPILISSPPIFVLLDVFFPKSHETLRILPGWVLSLPKRRTMVLGWN